jgi:hypothetical protein
MVYFSEGGIRGNLCARSSFRALLMSRVQHTTKGFFDAYLGFVPENSGNKSSDIAADPLTDKFPTNKVGLQTYCCEWGKIKNIHQPSSPNRFTS